MSLLGFLRRQPKPRQAPRPKPTVAAVSIETDYRTHFVSAQVVGNTAVVLCPLCQGAHYHTKNQLGQYARAHCGLGWYVIQEPRS